MQQGQRCLACLDHVTGKWRYDSSVRPCRLIPVMGKIWNQTISNRDFKSLFWFVILIWNHFYTCDFGFRFQIISWVISIWTWQLFHKSHCWKEVIVGWLSTTISDKQKSAIFYLFFVYSLLKDGQRIRKSKSRAAI